MATYTMFEIQKQHPDWSRELVAYCGEQIDLHWKIMIGQIDEKELEVTTYADVPPEKSDA